MIGGGTQSGRCCGGGSSSGGGGFSGLDALAAFTVSLGALASGAARQATLIENTTDRRAAMIWCRIKSGAVAPVAGSIYEVFLVRRTAFAASYETDNGGLVDAPFTPQNAQLLGAIVVTNTADTVFTGEFDTSSLGPLSEYWGIAVRNGTNQALAAANGDHTIEFQTYD